MNDKLIKICMFSNRKKVQILTVNRISMVSSAKSISTSKFPLVFLSSVTGYIEVWLCHLYINCPFIQHTCGETETLMKAQTKYKVASNYNPKEQQ